MHFWKIDSAHDGCGRKPLTLFREDSYIVIVHLSTVRNKCGSVNELNIVCAHAHQMSVSKRSLSKVYNTRVYTWHKLLYEST